MAEGLKIIVDADVKRATKALATDLPRAVDKATGSFTGLSTQAANASRAIERSLPPALTKTTSAAKVLQPQVSKLGETLETLRAKLGARQSFLLTEKDPERVAALNKEISVLKTEITRIGNIGKAGFDSLGNAIVPVATNLDKTANAGKRAFSVLRTAANILPGLGISGLILGLSNLVVGLFKASESFSAAEIRAIRFKTALDAIRESAENLKSSLDLQRTLDTLDFKIKSGEGPAADVFEMRREMADNIIVAERYGASINLLQNKFNQLNKQIVQSRKVALQLRKEGFKTPEIEILSKDIDINQLSGDQLKKFSASGREFVEKYQNISKELNEQIKIRADAFNANRVLEKKILLAQAKDVKDAFNKSIDDIGKIKPLRLPIPIEPIINLSRIKFILLGGKEKLFADRVREEINKDIEGLVVTPKISISPELAEFNRGLEILRAQQAEMARIFGLQQDSPLNQMQKEAVAAAQTINGLLSPAFDGLFNAILSGQEPMKAFFKGLGNAVTQLIQKLIQAALTAAILSAIFPGGVGGIKGFGAIFSKILGFAQGGIVSGPTLALIGEGAGTSRSNPEVVAPLDQLKSMLGGINNGGYQRVVVTGRLRGNDMYLQNARTLRKQKRTTGA